MITPGSLVITVKPINDDGVNIQINTQGVVVALSTCVFTDIPMFVVDFNQELVGCFPDDITLVTPIRRGEWV